MRSAMTLGLMLVLLAATAQGASGPGSVEIDIIGSNAENTNITAPYGASVDLDIVGSTTNEIQIMPMGASAGGARYGCYSGYCDSCGGNITYHTPWDDFRRPLCYPWSSYIPTRYNKLYYNRYSECSCDSHKVLTLGQGLMKP